MLKRILIPVDGSDSAREAFDFVASRKSWLESDAPVLTLLNVEPTIPPHLASAFSIFDREAYAAAQAAAVFKKLGIDKAELPAEPEKKVVSSNDAGEAIVKYAAQSEAEMIVMGARGNSMIEGVFLGSVSQSVIVKSKTPLMIVHPQSAPKKASLKVGIAVDGSDYGMAAVDFIIRAKNFFGANAEFVVITVVPDYAGLIANYMSAMASKIVPNVPDMEAEDYVKIVKPVVDKLTAAGLKASGVQLKGRPGKMLADYTAEHLDMIVAGSHGKGNLKALVVGTTARDLAANLRKPLILIRI